MSLPTSLLELAECPSAHWPLDPGDARIERPTWVAWLGAGGVHPAFNVVQRLRFDDDDVPAAVAEIRALLAQRGRARSTWEIGPSATPADLEPRLLALGMKPFEEPLAWGMVSTGSIPTPASEVVARRAETIDDYVIAFDVMSRVFRERTESAAERRARAEHALERHRSGRGALFLGLLEGEAVAASNAIYTDEAVMLCGGATLPYARGRGAYRALVAARYEDAVRRKTPVLVVQAGAMSRPILERLGFVSVAEVRILLDEA